MTASFDVVVVNYNTREDLVACLASLTGQRPAGLARVYVVDNASTDGSADAVRASWPAVDIVALERNVGFAAANNVGLRLAAAPLVLLLNADTIVSAGALDVLAERLEATGAVAAGPLLCSREGRPEVSFGPMLSPLGELGQWCRMRMAASHRPLARRYVERLVARERYVDWVSGACLLVRRAAALAAGLFDERYFLYEEDVDFCAALRARGGRVLFTPRARLTHLRGQAARRTGGASRRHYDQSHLAFYEKHAPFWAPVLRVWLGLRGRTIR
jgi:N-acetylglucosaminyl-diphospho-decaprenol L-rhamnosyltransferase